MSSVSFVNETHLCKCLISFLLYVKSFIFSEEGSKHQYFQDRLRYSAGFVKYTQLIGQSILVRASGFLKPHYPFSF